MSSQLIKVSDEAKIWLETQLAGQEYVGIKVVVNQKGCAGGEYEFTPVGVGTNVAECDMVVDNGLRIYFPRLDLFKIIGSTLVLQRDKFNTRLDFNNPNEDSRCGCGESVSFKTSEQIIAESKN